MTRPRTRQKGEHHGATAGGKQPYLYRIWSQIKQRCYNKNCVKYPDYGGRGIDMDPMWKDSFGLFQMEIQKRLGKRPSPKHSLGRINQDKGYWPGNIKWQSAIELMRNKRNNHLVFYQGNWMTIAELAQKSGFEPGRLQHRIVYQKLSVEEALKRPLEGGNKYIDWKGEYHSLSTWSRRLGLPYDTINSRLELGWPVDRAFTTPKRKYQSKK